MAKFIAVHPLETPLTSDEVAPSARRVKAESTLDAYWVGSWLVLNEEGNIIRIYCEWDGKDAESIRSVLAKSAPELPTEGVYPMGEIHGEDYR